MTVLITGGAGFIGSHLANHLLATGFTVHVVDNFYPNYNPAQKRRNVLPNLTNPVYQLHEGDIRCRTSLKALFRNHTFDLVIHLAALAGVQESFQRPDEYFDINVTGTRNLLDMMHQTGVRKLIFGSSSSVYGDKAPLPLREDFLAMSPISPYATTKYQAEQVCRQYYQRYTIEMACLRFFTVYGPGQRPDMAISRFLAALHYQQPLTIYGEGSRRDYTYVADIVQGISKVIPKISGFEVYNIGSGTHLSVKQLIETVESVTGQLASVENKPDRKGDVTHTWADLTKARQMLDYQPVVNLEIGIKKMNEWVRYGKQSLD